MKTTNERRLDHLFHCILNGRLLELAEQLAMENMDEESVQYPCIATGRETIRLVEAMKWILEEIEEN